MNKILEIFKSLVERWKKLSSARKISIIILAVGFAIGIILLSSYLNKASYDTLFSNLEPQDAAQIIEKLKSENIKYIVDGNTILVPKNKAAELRMSVAMDTSYQNKGFEIFDQSKFGVTDTENKIMFQRALEGELARSIQSLDEVENARVHLVLPDESVFVREKEEAKASVVIKPKGMRTLPPEKVKAIIVLVTGAVKDLSNKNVQVIDTNANLLSEGLYDEGATGGTISAIKQQEYEKQYENKLQNDVKQMLEAIFGEGKVRITINANLNFDSTQVTTIKYDKDDVVLRSKRALTNQSQDGSSQSGSTGVDGQFGDGGYTFPDGTGTPSSSTQQNDEIINNEIGQTQEVTVKAPGEVTRLTVSVVIDGTLNDAEKTEINNIVAAAAGFDEKRGDFLVISAMPFNTDKKDELQKAQEEMDKQLASEKKTQLYTRIAEGAGAFILLLTLIIMLSRRSKSKVPVQVQEETVKSTIDVVVGDNVVQNPVKKQPVFYEPVLDEGDGDMNIEKEIQSYATKKPDQVVEVIRTWLSDDESR